MPAGRLKSSMNLELDFENTGLKQLTVYLNDKPLSIETRKNEWKSTVNKYLVEGQNSLIIIPATEMTLTQISLK